MNNITPQDLKLLAAWVGREDWIGYDPLEPDKSLELLKKLLDEDLSIAKNTSFLDGSIAFEVIHPNTARLAQGKSLELAIVQAALVHIRGEK